eukprot:352498-Chlamydomonas_euryale.AAC.4
MPRRTAFYMHFRARNGSSLHALACPGAERRPPPAPDSVHRDHPAFKLKNLDAVFAKKSLNVNAGGMRLPSWQCQHPSRVCAL